MSSNNYAVKSNIASTKETLDLMRKNNLTVFHIDVTGADEDLWGKGGMDIDRLECAYSQVDFYFVKALISEAYEIYGVSFGTGGPGWCIRVGEKYFWVAPKRNHPEPPVPETVLVDEL